MNMGQVSEKATQCLHRDLSDKRSVQLFRVRDHPGGMTPQRAGSIQVQSVQQITVAAECLSVKARAALS
jgi:hypothetical protein